MNTKTLAGSQNDGLSQQALRLASPARPNQPKYILSSSKLAGSVNLSELGVGTMNVTCPEYSEQVQAYIDKHGADGKLYCSQHKVGAKKPRATYILHYVVGDHTYHEPMCNEHANAASGYQAVDAL